MTVLSLLFTKDVLLLMGTPETIMNDAVSYIQIIFLFMSVSYAYNFLSGIFRAVGDSKNPDIAMVIACIINVV